MKKHRAKPAAKKEAPYDVFISYSSKDKAWVQGELLKRIEKNGLRAFVDYRDFTRGAPSIKEMERGVVECRKTLLVLTPDYIDSEWCDIESVMAQTLSPANRDLRMIPLLKTPCDKPVRIAALTHVDFTEGADFDLAWRQLLTALGKAPEPPQPVQPSREHWNLVHPYAMPPNFTGRLAERKMLTDWLTGDTEHPLLVLRALGGFGKSALTWHWLLHDVDPVEHPRVVWWSFYEGDASFESFVANAVRYLDPNSATSASPREQLVSVLKALHSRGTLLILDGFERALRAFGGLNAAYQGDETVGTQGGERDCISPLADTFFRSVLGSPGIQGKVLLTTRLRPSAVETREGILLKGCREEELVQLQPADSVAFFRAQGIRGGRAEIEAACAPYGYHPLSLRLLAGLIVNDFQQPGDIAAAQHMDVSGDLVQRQHHVLEQAYTSLSPARQKLLSRIACFRGAVSYDALKALSETELSNSDALVVGGLKRKQSEGSLDDLRDLIARGLLHRDLGTNRFDLHPIVRRYSYDRLAALDRIGAHSRLRDYFAAVPAPEKVRSLDDLAPVIELYHHTLRAGQYDEARKLFRDRLDRPTYYQFGAYQLQVELLLALFPDGEDCQPALKTEKDQASTLNDLACVYSLTGQPRRSVPLFERQIAIDEKQGDNFEIAASLENLATQQLKIGSLRATETSLRRSLLLLSRETQNQFLEAVGLQELGRLLACRGAWTESETELATALEMFENINDLQSQGIVWTYRALRELLRLRSTLSDELKAESADLVSAIAPARRALELADETAQIRSPFERDYVRSHWLLGSAYRVARELVEAEHHLHEAIERCRRINMVDHEADILIDLARLGIATAAPDEAGRFADKALLITERSGYVLQGADAHLVLAQLSKNRGDVKQLRHHAEEALRLATCDGPPDYTYKAAYDEASALLR
jgi:tetratricopeptide (TPR) repeat protein